LDVGANVYYGWNQLPALTLDPTYVAIVGFFTEDAFAESAEVGRLEPGVATLEQKVAAGGEVISSTYKRRLAVGADMVFTAGKYLFKTEVAYSPNEIIYTEKLETPQVRTVSWSAGIDHRPTDALRLTAEGYGRFALDAAPPNDSFSKYNGTDSSVAALVGYSPEGSIFEVDVTATYSIMRKNWLTAFEVRAEISDDHLISVGGVLLDGAGGQNGGGAFGDNDSLFFRYRWKAL